MPRNGLPEKFELASLALEFFMKNEWSREQASGLIANIEAESGFNPQAIGDIGLAFGICQWHPDRQADFRAQFRRSIKDANYAEQLEFVVFELKNKESRAGKALHATSTAEEAGEVVCLLYERRTTRTARCGTAAARVPKTGSSALLRGHVAIRGAAYFP